MIINKINETQNLLSLNLVFFLVGLRTYQHPCSENINESVIEGAWWCKWGHSEWPNECEWQWANDSE